MGRLKKHIKDWNDRNKLNRLLESVLIISLITNVTFGSVLITVSAFNDKEDLIVQKTDKKVELSGFIEPSEKPLEPVTEELVVEQSTVPITIEEKIQASCEVYGVPFDIVLAIARLETGWFKSDAYIYRNNPGGMSVNEVPLSYSSIDEGVDAMVSNLANNYFAIGLTTPELIGQKYCPSNPTWAALVRELMSYGY